MTKNQRAKKDKLPVELAALLAAHEPEFADMVLEYARTLEKVGKPTCYHFHNVVMETEVLTREMILNVWHFVTVLNRPHPIQGYPRHEKSPLYPRRPKPDTRGPQPPRRGSRALYHGLLQESRWRRYQWI